MNIIIRNETPSDYHAVEALTRESFWNVYKPGADEHYFVHMMRSHPDFIPELAFVLEKDGEIIGKNGTPERTKFFVRKSRIKEAYCDKIRYIFRLVI